MCTDLVVDELKAPRAVATAKSRHPSLSYAQRIARQMAGRSESRECYAEMVQERLRQEGIHLGPAAGSLFPPSEWEFTGRWWKCQYRPSHSSLQRIWRLK